MRGWSGLNKAPWDCADLAAMVEDYQPPEAFCCCLAVQPEIVAIDLDIEDPIRAVAAARLADEILGITPLVRIGHAPKSVRVYRNGDGIRSQKLYPVEIFAGSGQIVAFGGPACLSATDTGCVHQGWEARRPTATRWRCRRGTRPLPL
jgi:hypothetical protein